MNRLARDQLLHSSQRWLISLPSSCLVRACVEDAVKGLKSLPKGCARLAICDPPYNLRLADWDDHCSYVDWAADWLDQIDRVLAPDGSVALFGGLQFQNEQGGDLLELVHSIRRRFDWKLVNFIVWHYANGMSAHRFFANRHEQIAWFATGPKYVFNLDAVREPYDEATQRSYRKDKRLRPETIAKGRNPTNVWRIPRLASKSKERTGHPTQKPRALIRRLVRALTNPGDLIVDPFSGSGVSGRIALEEGRSAILFDRDPATLSQLERQMAYPEKIAEEVPVESETGTPERRWLANRASAAVPATSPEPRDF